LRTTSNTHLIYTIPLMLILLKIVKTLKNVNIKSVL